MLQVADGYIEGGTAQNIELGFHPRYVRILNLTEGTEVYYDASLYDVLRFDGGGTEEIEAGYTIQAADDGWSAVVAEVVLISGTWAGGDAAGYLVLEPGSLTGAGNLADNDNIKVATQKGGDPSGNWATLNTATNYRRTFDTDTEVGFIASNDITPYDGTAAGNGVGFSIGTGIGSADDLLYYIAFGGGAG